MISVRCTCYKNFNTSYSAVLRNLLNKLDSIDLLEGIRSPPTPINLCIKFFDIVSQSALVISQSVFIVFEINPIRANKQKRNAEDLI